jgi:hypothetical protein
MTSRLIYHGCQEEFEYHGNTVVERVRKQNGRIEREWFTFDSVDEAADFFYDHCACCEAA